MPRTSVAGRDWVTDPKQQSAGCMPDCIVVAPAMTARATWRLFRWWYCCWAGTQTAATWQLRCLQQLGAISLPGTAFSVLAWAGAALSSRPEYPLNHQTDCQTASYLSANRGINTQVLSCCCSAILFEKCACENVNKIR